MVSPLSSRIFSLEAKKTNRMKFTAFPTNEQDPAWQTQDASKTGGKKRVSGYMADRESRDSPTLKVADKKSRRSNEVEMTAKRQKIAQLNFQASRARSDLADVGIHCPPGVFVGKSKLHLPGLDKSKVDLYIATKDKPYTDGIPAKTSFAGNIISPSAFCSGTPTDYADLINDSRVFYATNKPISFEKDFLNQPDSCPGGSIATPSESSESDSDLGSINIPARVENYQSTSQDRPEENDKDAATFSFSVTPRSPEVSEDDKSTSLQDVLVQRSPCFVVKATGPHPIVHVNGSFSKLTNESHARALTGRLLSDILPTMDLTDMLSSPSPSVRHYDVSLMVTQDDTKVSLKNMKNLALHLTIRPILALPKPMSDADTTKSPGPRTITHLSFEFKNHYSPNDSMVAIG